MVHLLCQEGPCLVLHPLVKFRRDTHTSHR